MNLKIAHYQALEEKRLASLFTEKFCGTKVLDLGCGAGRNFPLLQHAGCQITGIDANAGQIATLKRQGFDAQDQDWEPLQESFDVILASHIIEHMAPNELCPFMDKWLAALKNGGSLIVLTPVLGERFYYDFTHIRPYYPQSIRMMFGGIDTAKSSGCKWKMELQDIWFFRDPFRMRMTRAFYPVSKAKGFIKAVTCAFNMSMAALWSASYGRVGRLASWLGIYKKLGENP